MTLTTTLRKPSRHLPFWEPLLADGTEAALAAVAAANFLNEGRQTAALEAAVAAVCEVSHGVAATSGTVAIFMALAACGVGAGDEVIVPDLTYIATANAVTMTGAKPVLADVSPDTLCLDPAAFEAAITSRTRAVVPVHVSGRAAAMPEIVAIARRHGLKIVEDAAEALGSRGYGRPLGSWGDAGCFSFSPNKTVSCGQGGMVVTDDPALTRRLRELKLQGRAERGTGGADEHPTLGFNFKMTDMQAGVALLQMAELPARLERLRAFSRAYRDGLANLPGIRVLPFDVDGGETPQWPDILVEDREGLAAFLEAAGIGFRRLWHPLHTHPPYRSDAAAFPVSAQASPRALWLPSTLTLSDEEIGIVIDHIRAWALGRATQ